MIVKGDYIHPDVQIKVRVLGKRVQGKRPVPSSKLGCTQAR